MSSKHHILKYARAVLEGVGIVFRRKHKQIGRSVVIGIAVDSHYLGIESCQTLLQSWILHSHNLRVLCSMTSWSICSCLKNGAEELVVYLLVTIVAA